MIAVDTNVLVRFLTWDDPEQAAQAKALLGGQDVFAPKTVLLETEWVLRSLYGLSASQIAAALRGVVGLPRLHCEDPDAVVMALGYFEQGLDFADALHLSSARATLKFATFDQRFRKRDQGICPSEIAAVADLVNNPSSDP